MSVVGVAQGQSQAPQELLRQYKCYICHADDETKTGPAYVDVAARYRGNPQAVASLGISPRELTVLQRLTAGKSNKEIAAELAKFPASAEVVWVQEEPANMGSWPYLALHLPNDLNRRVAAVCPPFSTPVPPIKTTLQRLRRKRGEREGLDGR